MDRILIADPLEESGLEILRAAGAEVQVLAEADRPRLAELLPGFDALVVRSATKVTRQLLQSAERLRVIGRAGIGVDNVDVEAATERGILVVNAPTANLMSATEHTVALMLSLARSVPAADASMKRGEWNRKRFVGVELQGKTLGIVGFGRIGQRVAARARAFEMKVVAFDPFFDASQAARHEVELLALDELLAVADVVTLHTPLTSETRNLIDASRLARMKPEAMLINCGRGGVIDEDALLAALDGGQLAGAALDVYEEEPTPRLALVEHAKVVATPHIGAQTKEAQERIAHETARMVLAALEGAMPAAAVNLPFAPGGRRAEPFLALAERLGRLAVSLLDSPLVQLEVELAGQEADLLPSLGVAALKGALTPALGDSVNYVNADRIAAGRGIRVVRSTHAESPDYPHLVRVRAGSTAGSAEVAGAIFGAGEPRVVGYQGYRLEFEPRGRLLLLESRDVPGAVGRIGTSLGEAGINIADIHLARQEATRQALSVLRIDGVATADVLARLRTLDAVKSVKAVDLGG